MTRRDASLGVAVLLSGAAGLMYQVAWTRKLTTVTSASVTAQALVLGIFMAGLGLGAALGGRFSGRLRSPAQGYAAVEIVAALFAMASFPVITTSDWIRTSLYGLGVPLGMGLWVQLFTVGLGLLVTTTLLGASLPLLIEEAERTGTGELRARRGRLVAALYGVNTAGAVFGSYISGFWTIEHFGLALTGAGGAALACTAGILVVITASRRISADRPVEHGPGPGPEPRFLLAAGLAGFAGLAAEVVWIRLFSLIIPTTVYAFSSVLIAVLLGIVLGAALAGAASLRPRGGDLLVRLAGGGAALAGAVMATIPLLVIHLSDQTELQKALASGRGFVPALLLLAVVVPTSGCAPPGPSWPCLLWAWGRFSCPGHRHDGRGSSSSAVLRLPVFCCMELRTYLGISMSGASLIIW
jgi:spermidine synthase